MPILHTTKSGSGPIIIMLHGFLSSSSYFRRFRKRFEKEYTVITIDLLGSGKSVRPVSAVTYDDQINSLHETLQQFKPPFMVIGHSMGAVLAARYANEFPNDVSSLTLFNPPLFSTKKEARKSIESSGLHYRAILTHPRSRLIWKFMKILPRIPQGIAPPLNLGDSLRTHYHAREGGYENIITQAEFINDLTALQSPGLLVTGTRDRYVYQETLGYLKIPPHIVVKHVDTGHHTLVSHEDLAEELVRLHLLQ